MPRFTGTLTRTGNAPEEVVVQIAQDRCTIVGSPTKHWIGSWNISDLSFERVTPLKFAVMVEGELWTFVPEAAAQFADAVGVVIDLRTGHRYGLAERIRKAQEEELAAGN
jgi:hypothetical protein